MHHGYCKTQNTEVGFVLRGRLKMASMFWSAPLNLLMPIWLKMYERGWSSNYKDEIQFVSFTDRRHARELKSLWRSLLRSYAENLSKSFEAKIPSDNRQFGILNSLPKLKHESHMITNLFNYSVFFFFFLPAKLLSYLHVV